MFHGCGGSQFPVSKNKCKSRDHFNMAGECSLSINSSLNEWLSVVLQRGVVIIKNRGIVQCSCEETFGALVRKVAPELEEERVKRVVISADKKFVDVHEVAMEAPISVCRLFNCKHCCIYFESADSTHCEKRGV